MAGDILAERTSARSRPRFQRTARCGCRPCRPPGSRRRTGVPAGTLSVNVVSRIGSGVTGVNALVAARRAQDEIAGQIRLGVRVPDQVDRALRCDRDQALGRRRAETYRSASRSAAAPVRSRPTRRSSESDRAHGVAALGAPVDPRVDECRPGDRLIGQPGFGLCARPRRRRGSRRRRAAADGSRLQTRTRRLGAAPAGAGAGQAIVTPFSSYVTAGRGRRAGAVTSGTLHLPGQQSAAAIEADAEADVGARRHLHDGPSSGAPSALPVRRESGRLHASPPRDLRRPRRLRLDRGRGLRAARDRSPDRPDRSSGSDRAAPSPRRSRRVRRASRSRRSDSARGRRQRVDVDPLDVRRARPSVFARARRT